LTRVSRHRFGFDAAAARASNRGLQNQSRHPRRSALGSEDKTNMGYSIKHARNRDFTIISYRVDIA
jgi:hypothetical protein